MTFDETLQQELSNMVRVSLDFARAHNFEPTTVYVYGYINDGFYYYNTFYKRKDQKHNTKQILPPDKNGIMESSILLTSGVKVLRQLESFFHDQHKEVPLVLQTIYDNVNHTLDVNLTYLNEFDSKELSDNYNGLFEEWKESS